MSAPKVTIHILGYNHDFAALKPCIDACLAQDFPDFAVWFTDNASAQPVVPEIEAAYQQAIHAGRLSLFRNHTNLGYAGGHNLFFETCESEFLMVINPDAILDAKFLSNIIAVFSDSRIAAATGKMLKPQPNHAGEYILDGTGITINRARRGRERGQNDPDRGQYDDPQFGDVFGVSGTAAVYRRSALRQARMAFGDGSYEYFDRDFFLYWEDMDLSWRLRLLGWNCAYCAAAMVFHARVAGASQRGYKDIAAFRKHHAALPLKIRKWQYRNHIFVIIKNDFGWNFWNGLPWIIVRETAMFGYLLAFEIKTLAVLPEFFRLLPRMLAKRRMVQKKRTIRSAQIENISANPAA